MATTKKTVKTDATDKKSNATKKTTTTKKKTTTKKEVESTGVVDEFLNENMGKVVTETPKPAKKKTATKKVKTEEETLAEFAQQTENGTLSLPMEEKKKTTTKKKTTSKAKKVEEEKIKDAEAQINEVMKETVAPVDNQEKTPEERWNDLGLTNEMQEEIKEVVKEIGNKEVKNENLNEIKNPITVETITTPIQYKPLDDKYSTQKPKRTYYEVINVEYPPKPNEEEIKEEVKNNEKDNKTIEDTNKEINNLRVNLEEKKPANKFTLVNWSMGVRYD